MQNIAGELRSLRHRAQKTLAQLAEETGLSVSFLSEIERGRVDPSLATLRKVAAACGAQIVVAFVWGLSDENHPTDPG